MRLLLIPSWVDVLAGLRELLSRRRHGPECEACGYQYPDGHVEDECPWCGARTLLTGVRDAD